MYKLIVKEHTTVVYVGTYANKTQAEQDVKDFDTQTYTYTIEQVA